MRLTSCRLPGLLLASVLAAASVRAAETPPNLLIIIADDCSYTELPLFGGRNVATPHIDRLAEQGVLFRRAYVSMSMCVPCRAELYTGLFPLRNGVAWNHSSATPGTVGIVQHLSAFGYRTGIAGKVHATPRTVFPFEMVEGFERNCVAVSSAHNVSGIRAFMTRDRSKPFCLIVGLVVPHAPWTVGDPLAFDRAKLVLPPHFPDTPETRESLAKYLAEIAHMDTQVGDIVSALEAAGQAERTAVFFTSEQGGQWPGCKWTNWEQGLHTALIVRWPGRVKPGARTDALVQYADVLPTLLDMAGGKPEAAGFDGTSFLRVLTGDVDIHRQFAYAMHNNVPEGPPYPIRSVTDGRFHYIRNLTPDALYIEKHIMGATAHNPYWLSWMWASESDPRAYAMVRRYMRRPAEELYDTAADPFELANLAAVPAHAARKAALAAELTRWMAEQGDPGAQLDTHEAFRRNLEAASPSRAPEPEFPVSPYVDPAQLDCPWPKMSPYKQPWRGYLETKSGYDFLRGLGINLQIPAGTEEPAIRLLAESGFRAARIEVGWGDMAWDETRLNSEDRIARRLELCLKHGIRPTILLNAHQGVPCPTRFFSRRLVVPAPKGARSVRLDNLKDIVPGRTGLSGLTDYWAAEALVIEIDSTTGEAKLSKPLPKELPAGEVAMATLKYAPLFPAGTPEFAETAAGWVRYALHVCRAAHKAGHRDFDIEIWNELTFGTRFLDINSYYDSASPKAPGKQPDFLNSGGCCWELARLTVEAVKKELSAVRCVWGFSNTTFYHCRVENLPPGIDGQSYHPYGTGTRRLEGKPQRTDQPPVEGYMPTCEIRMPEGWAHTYIQTECLMRLLRPDERLARRPPHTVKFHHYITEHGVLPPECGVKDPDEAWRLKALCLTRSFCLWLNKGIDVVHYFNAWEEDPTSFGILPPGLKRLAPDARFDDVATPPMRALRNLTRAFEGSVPLEKTAPLSIEVVALGAQTKVFEGDAAHPPLMTREVLAALPFQVAPGKHVIAVYVMTRDAARPFPPARFRLRIGGAKGARAAYVDPHEEREIPIDKIAASGDVVDVTLEVAGHPRLLSLASEE